MKNILCLPIILCLALNATAQTVQYVTLIANGQIPALYPKCALQTNQVVTIVGYDWVTRPGIIGQMANGAAVSMNLYFIQTLPSSSSYVLTSSQFPQIITGLTNIQIGGFSNSWATIKIETPNTATVISNYVPADAIVIPTSATGNVQIILESSADLVNWTGANPGTYGMSSATNRFFRVRAAMLP